VLDLPVAVRLAAGHAVGPFGATADHDRRVVLPAITAALDFVAADRRDLVAVAALRVVSGDRLIVVRLAERRANAVAVGLLKVAADAIAHHDAGERAAMIAVVLPEPSPICEPTSAPRPPPITLPMMP